MQDAERMAPVSRSIPVHRPDFPFVSRSPEDDADLAILTALIRRVPVRAAPSSDEDKDLLEQIAHTVATTPFAR